jgi:hypothetical protein
MSGQPPKSVLTGPVEQQEPLLIHDLPTDNVVATITALAGELFVVKDRLAALQLELERAGVVAESSLESQQLDATERQQRQQELDGFVQRVMSELTRDRTPSSQIRKQAHQYLSAYGASENDG